jgi:hypothetical protein
MAILWQEQLRPGVALQEIVQEATAALVSMNADRLEELARCCEDLNREVQQTGDWEDVASSLKNSEKDLKLLELVLRETRANLTVLSRLRSLQQTNPEWRCGEWMESGTWPRLGRSSKYGDD